MPVPDPAPPRPGTEKPLFEPEPLALAVRERATERGITLKAAAAEMALTYSHLMALCSGQRRFSGVRRDKMARIAAFLGVPVVHCYLLAGTFTPGDFVVARKLPHRLRLTLGKLRADPDWAAFAPSDTAWDGWPEAARVLICLLYERDSLEGVRRALRAK